MVSKKIVAATAVATVGVSAQVDGIISSILTQISNGIVAGRSSGVDSASASSEVAEIISVLNQNSDITNLLTAAASGVLGGISSDGVISLVNGAKSSIAAFEGSEDYVTLESLVSAHSSDFDPASALASVSANLSPVLGLVLPPIYSLSSTDSNVASAVNEASTLISGIFSALGLATDRAAATTSASAEASSTAEATSTAAATSASETASASESAAESTSEAASASASASASESAAGTAGTTKASESTASIVTKSVSSSKTGVASATGASSTTLSQVNGQSTLKGGIIAAGVVAAGALLL